MGEDGGKTPSASDSPDSPPCPFGGRRRLPQGMSMPNVQDTWRSSSSDSGSSNGTNANEDQEDGGKTPSVSDSPDSPPCPFGGRRRLLYPGHAWNAVSKSSVSSDSGSTKSSSKSSSDGGNSDGNQDDGGKTSSAPDSPDSPAET